MSDVKMTEVVIGVDAGAHRVFEELSDGWAYAGWVVGATHIRDVDAEWPAVGSKIHHMVGCWPMCIADNTEVLASVPGELLRLRARGWPFGDAVIEIVLVEHSPWRTEITLREAPDSGPGKWFDNPGLRAALKLRNTETLRRLKDRVEKRTLLVEP